MLVNPRTTATLRELSVDQKGRKTSNAQLPGTGEDVLYMHRVLKSALAVAVTEWQLLPWNPADPIKAPKLKRTSMRALDAGEAAALLEAARPYRLFIPVLLAVTCGSRAVRFAPCAGATLS